MESIPLTKSDDLIIMTIVANFSILIFRT